MSVVFILLVAAGVFGVCFLVDRLFTRLFRSRAQHRSGMAVRASKRYGAFGVILMVLGVAALIFGENLRVPGTAVLLMGAGMAVYYLSYGIFYDGESFLVSSLGRKSRTYYYRDIRAQQLYIVTGGNVIVELHMENGETVSVNTQMDGVYPFLDTAFAGWCLQTGRDPQSCDFHDPSQSCWFPAVEEG